MIRDGHGLSIPASEDHHLSEPDRSLKSQLASTQNELSERTRERDEIQLRLVKSDKRLAAAEAELGENRRVIKESDNVLSVANALIEARDTELVERTALLAASALELSHRTAELREANRFLASRTEELEFANKELRIAMQQREDFVAALTHDLKGPLISASKIIELMVNGRVPPEQSDAVLNQLLVSHQNMVRMIRNLLDVYRHESGSLVPNIEEIDISLILNECLSELQFSISEKEIQCDVEILSGLQIDSDGMLLRRVFSNLLDNAVKFTPKGGTLGVKAGCHENTIEVSITDSGHGMCEEQRQQIFLKFWQSKEGREHGVGTGLGLFISKQIAEMLGVELECQSEVGKGTKFLLSIPCNQQKIKVTAADLVLPD